MNWLNKLIRQTPLAQCEEKAAAEDRKNAAKAGYLEKRRQQKAQKE